MLEQMRRQGASTFVYVLFTILIAGMVYSLAPSGNRAGGCSTTSNTVVSVDGVDATETSYRVAYSANGAKGRQKVYVALDQIVRRELLAQAAADHGIRPSEELIDQEIGRGYFFLGGVRVDFRRQFLDENDLFRYKQLKAWVDSLAVSIGSYREEQARSLQASLMSDLFATSVRVSREEALADYLYDHDTVTYDVVAFEPGKYSRAMRFTDADVKRFLDTHGAEVEARYKADERTYKGVKPQLALREIFIPKAVPEAAKPADDKAAAKPADDKAKPADDKAKPADAKATAKPADDKAKPADAKTAKPADDKAKPADKKADKGADKPAVGDAPKPFGLPIEVAKAKLEAVRAQILAGKLTFPEAEKQLAADASEDAPATNGDHGWRSAESPGLGDKAIDDAAKTLKPGEMTPVVVTERGVFLVIATDKREGDLSYEQVKSEIAKELARDVWGKEAAKRDALAALAKAQTSKQSLGQLFEHEAKPPGGGGIEELLNNPDIPEETKRQLLQRYMQQMQPPKSGSLELHEKDVPVAWYAEADGSSAAPAAGSAVAPAAAAANGSAPPAAGNTPPAAAGSATPAAAGSATPAAAGSASGASSSAPAAPAPPPAAPIVASTDVLPQLDAVPKAKVNRLGPAPRQGTMPGLGHAKEAIEALFGELTPGALANRVYEGDAGAYILVQLIDHTQPKVEEFDKIADAEIARMRDARGKAAVHDWLKARCDTLTKAKRIQAAADRIRETDDKGDPAPTVYKPCMYFDALDR
jgi:hypothetical protein